MRHDQLKSLDWRTRKARLIDQASSTHGHCPSPELLPLRFKTLSTLWVQSFAVFSLLAAVAYALPPGRAASPILIPGVGLYVVLNGSLLFGSGFGGPGDCLVIVFGSAAVWASLFAVLLMIVRNIVGRE